MPFENYVRLPVTPETTAVVAAAREYLPPADVQVVLYHSTFTNPCNDGSAAAMAAWKVLGDKVEYIPYNPSDKKPFDLGRLAGKNTLLMDCSFNLETLTQARAIAPKVAIMDHHMPEQTANKLVGVEGCFFTPDNSAGAMGWLYFNGVDAEIPLVVDLVQRQDVFKLSSGAKVTTSESDQVAAALRTCNGFDQYKTVYPELLDIDHLEALRQKGAGIIEANRLWCAEMATKAKLCTFKPNPTDSYTVIALQLAPEKMREVTDLGELIWKNIGANPNNVQFVMFWCPNADGTMQLSLRSKFRTGVGLDVAALAKHLAGPKGGGHNEAAGCSLTLQGDFLTEIATQAMEVVPEPVVADQSTQSSEKKDAILTVAAVTAAAAAGAAGYYLTRNTPKV